MRYKDICFSAMEVVKKAAAYVEKAKQALSVFEASKIRDSLYDIADYALARRI